MRACSKNSDHQSLSLDMEHEKHLPQSRKLSGDVLSHQIHLFPDGHGSPGHAMALEYIPEKVGPFNSSVVPRAILKMIAKASFVAGRFLSRPADTAANDVSGLLAVSAGRDDSKGLFGDRVQPVRPYLKLKMLQKELNSSFFCISR
jgi:hypothetical protein